MNAALNFSDKGFLFVAHLSSEATKSWAASASSPAGIELLKDFEGVRLKAYQDTAGVWTIGWGSTRHADGTPVKKGDTLASIAAANTLFTITMSRFAAEVKRLVKVPLTQNQFDALVSFNFNTGALASSTLLKLLNKSDFAGAANEFPKWNKITDPKTKAKIVSGTLVKRRAAERKLFLTAAYLTAA